MCLKFYFPRIQFGDRNISEHHQQIVKMYKRVIFDNFDKKFTNDCGVRRKSKDRNFFNKTTNTKLISLRENHLLILYYNKLIC